MSKKLVRLKPLSPFFFGTNKTFSDETLHDVTSSYFPQQTHLLGMLRFFLLQTSGYIKLRRRGRWVSGNKFADAFKLVGGYNKRNPEQKEESLGIIKSLSPVFIVSKINNRINDFHFVAPKDTGLKIEVSPTENILYVANKEKSKQYHIKDYNPKNRYVNALTTSEFWNNYFNNTIICRDSKTKVDENYLEKLNLKSFDTVFDEVWQVGIKRDRKTKTVQSDDEGSFYNKTSYRFKNDSYEFAFIVDIDGEFKENEGFVYLGAERSSFKLEIEEYSSELEKLYPADHSNNESYIALSDIFLNDFSFVDFMLNDGYIAHAHMDRKKEKNGRASSKYNKSAQKNFIPKGSVVYFKDGFDFKSLNTKIGYNTFITKKDK